MNEEMLERTDDEYAPWTIIEATDKDYATIKIMRVIVAALEAELEKKKAADARKAEKKAAAAVEKNSLPEAGKTASHYKNRVLSGVDLSKSLDKKEYKEKLEKLQKRIGKLHSELYLLRIPVVLAFEGWDAGGKGGAIKRLTSHLDPRGYAVHPTSSPNDIEKVHHYLWRFWNNMPKA